MFVQERLDKIIKLINENNKVKVNELSDYFKVSKDLIRKDLSKLEEAGYLKRTYGGAIKIRHSAETLTISSRISKNVENKQKIALKALEEIKEGDLIFLDISSINYLLAQEIIKNNMNVTIITNMIDIMHLFSTNIDTKAKLIGIGGNCNKIIGGFVGLSSVEQIKKYNITKSFIGTIGINIDTGIVSTYEEDDGLTKKCIINSSKHRYLITEKSKIEQDGKYIFSSLTDFNCIIIDSDIENITRNKIKQFHINVK
ncbi:DeoR/GlpR family DNA-binding transcription regulator [Streptobacillus felis]|uniref:DeoR/GlpR family DNA-binding transcription regulator n=1 Tax=Streptobacillus felis TaxID=1384509 RepID=UPI0008311540|nr:DeoR/GlpR family DNA-binding transcription regulator [Streptobacillus felis]